jgi:hypothetical protein
MNSDATSVGSIDLECNNRAPFLGRLQDATNFVLSLLTWQCDKFRLIGWFVLAAGGLLLTGAMLRPSHMHSEGQPYHTKTFRMAYGGLPDTTNSLFTAAGNVQAATARIPTTFASIAGQSVPLCPCLMAGM